MRAANRSFPKLPCDARTPKRKSGLNNLVIRIEFDAKQTKNSEGIRSNKFIINRVMTPNKPHINSRIQEIHQKLRTHSTFHSMHLNQIIKNFTNYCPPPIMKPLPEFS